ncbi:MAG: alpha/beta hydrolase, partial [Acidimicrobiales bacterium]|nr:alpha/beta hydrolase [Acidimicrobiales bacterium]
LAQVQVPTLVLQCTDDLIAPTVVGRYVADNIPGARFQQLGARGHCPNLTAPDETALAIRNFLESEL